MVNEERGTDLVNKAQVKREVRRNWTSRGNVERKENGEEPANRHLKGRKVESKKEGMVERKEEEMDGG